jgi:predicted PurR-regulated permease PerM
MKKETINRSVLLALVAGISLLFLSMIQPFLLAIFMAALFAAMTRPVYLYLVHLLRGRPALASFANLLLLLFVVLIPVSVLLGIFIAQAVNVGETVTPLVVQALKDPNTFGAWLEKVPFREYVTPYENQITAKVAESVEAIGKFLVGGLSSFALGTANFLFMTLVFFYTLFFFQLDGPRVVERILYYLPLNDHDERRMLERFTSVTRAMIKGTLLIGMIQGALAGLAFAVAGVGNAVFWGTVMAVLSIVPGIGSAAIWVPASIILVFQGQVVAGIGLMLFCGLVVGSIDNVLRPKLVGKDANMHELMIFFGTLGGLFMFGMAGLLIGPLVASLFLTIWDIYGIAFKDMLPAVGPHPELRFGKARADDGSGAPKTGDETRDVAPTHDEALADWQPEDEGEGNPSGKET